MLEGLLILECWVDADPMPLRSCRSCVIIIQIVLSDNNSNKYDLLFIARTIMQIGRDNAAIRDWYNRFVHALTQSHRSQWQKKPGIS